MADDHEQQHTHQIPDSAKEPGVDAGTGKLERHCSQCGALIEGSDEFCQVCALEAAGDEITQDD